VRIGEASARGGEGSTSNERTDEADIDLVALLGAPTVAADAEDEPGEDAATS
jgi:hypothetical protein